jgi:TPR repeat protein
MLATGNAVATEQSVEAPDVKQRIDEAFEPLKAKPDTPPDFAFGAYQRGMYLTAFELALPRAEAGDAAAQTLIAELYDTGKGVAKDTKKATEWYEVAAASGNREAQFAYGMRLLSGQHVNQNTDRGIELMKKAADEGHPLAMFNYASYLIDQRPTTYGYRLALPYMEKAAEYRLADAYYSLSQIYGNGLATGVGNPEKGKEWLIRAARSGVDTAQIDLALGYLNGKYGDKDLKKARNWFTVAARSGNVIAQNRLAHMMFDGLGGEAKPVEGGMWHILANRAGRSDINLDQKLGVLDEESRKKALTMANRWPFNNG